MTTAGPTSTMAPGWLKMSVRWVSAYGYGPAMAATERGFPNGSHNQYKEIRGSYLTDSIKREEKEGVTQEP